MKGIHFNLTDIQITYIQKTLHTYLLPYLTSFNGGCFIIELFFKIKNKKTFRFFNGDCGLPAKKKKLLTSFTFNGGRCAPNRENKRGERVRWRRKKDPNSVEKKMWDENHKGIEGNKEGEREMRYLMHEVTVAGREIKKKHTHTSQRPCKLRKIRG